jgi:4-hydroxy-tetrahydrodipicolinate reductase
MSGPVRVIQCGLGAIGRAAARLVLERPSLQLVGAVDANPQRIGRDLGAVLELPDKLGVAVTREWPAGDVVIHCTTSKFEDCAAQIGAIARAGMHCVTSCEEALFPSSRHRALAETLDATCRQHGVAAVGTGVNPGFVMDTLPVALTAVCRRVDAVRVLRVVDAGTRREALQRKVGAGITVEEFHQRVKAGTLRHVGLPESAAFVADALGWRTGEIKEVIEPVLRADGRVAGVKQVATAGALTLELQMYVGAPNPRDEIEIAGDPPLHLVMRGGTPGDVATPAILVNMIPRLLGASPGFHTMRTLPLPGIAT